jgi:hypothetical protein
MNSQDLNDFPDSNSYEESIDLLNFHKRNELLEKQKELKIQLQKFKPEKVIELPLPITPYYFLSNHKDISIFTKNYSQPTVIAKTSQFTLTKFLFNFITKTMNIKAIRKV